MVNLVEICKNQTHSSFVIHSNLGIVVFAGDATPIDVISHLPVYCEDKNIPYIYVPLKRDISQAMGVYRPCLVVLIKRDDEYGELFDECVNAINQAEIVI